MNSILKTWRHVTTILCVDCLTGNGTNGEYHLVNPPPDSRGVIIVGGVTRHEPRIGRAGWQADELEISEV